MFFARKNVRVHGQKFKTFEPAMLSGCQLKQNKNLLNFTLGIRKLSKITLLNLKLFILYSQIRYIDIERKRMTQK
jgi:hypothetical protein